jgi:hypothetical protein
VAEHHAQVFHPGRIARQQRLSQLQAALTTPVVSTRGNRPL